LNLFLSSEIIKYNEFIKNFKEKLFKHEIFLNDEKKWDDLKDRIVEHNIRIISMYYSRITTKRLANLLNLNEDETEQFVSKMVQLKTISAKIDRIDGIISFIKNKDSNEILNNWSNDTYSILSMVDKSVHLINKELAKVKNIE
jgi:26S proteasome regulatory subunit N5